MARNPANDLLYSSKYATLQRPDSTVTTSIYDPTALNAKFALLMGKEWKGLPTPIQDGELTHYPTSDRRSALTCPML